MLCMGEPFRARLLTIPIVADSYVMMLPHAEASFRAFAVIVYFHSYGR